MEPPVGMIMEPTGVSFTPHDHSTDSTIMSKTPPDSSMIMSCGLSDPTSMIMSKKCSSDPRFKELDTIMERRHDHGEAAGAQLLS